MKTMSFIVAHAECTLGHALHRALAGPSAHPPATRICRRRRDGAGAGDRREFGHVRARQRDPPPAAALRRPGSSGHVHNRAPGKRPAAAIAARRERLHPVESHSGRRGVGLRVEREPHGPWRRRAAHRDARVRQLLRAHGRAGRARSASAGTRRAASVGAHQPWHVAAAFRRGGRCSRPADRPEWRGLHDRRRAAAGFRIPRPRRGNRGAVFSGNRRAARQSGAGIPPGSRSTEAWRDRCAGR